MDLERIVSEQGEDSSVAFRSDSLADSVHRTKGSSSDEGVQIRSRRSFERGLPMTVRSITGSVQDSHDYRGQISGTHLVVFKMRTWKKGEDRSLINSGPSLCLSLCRRRGPQGVQCE